MSMVWIGKVFGCQIWRCHYIGRRFGLRGNCIDLQFKDEDHFVLIFKSVVQVDQFVVVEMIHDVDLLPDQGLLHGVRDRDELGGKHVAGLDLSVVAQMLIQLR